MPKHYNQYKAKSAAWKKAKREHDEAVRKRKAVSTRLMNLKAKPIKKKKKGEYGGPEKEKNESATLTLKRIGIDPGKRKKQKKYEYKKGSPLVIVGEKQWKEYLKFSKRKRSDKQS